MKKVLMAALVAALSAAAHCAPAYMASQTWVTNRINRQVFESDRFSSIERAFLQYLPSLEDSWTFEDSGGTNQAYYVYQYGGYPLEGAFLIWDGRDTNPRTYTNAVFGCAYYVETNHTDIAFTTNVYSTVDYDYNTIEENYETAITNRFYDTTATFTPQYGETETIYIVNTNYVAGVEVVVTNEISQTPLIGYTSQIVTNGYEDVISVSTNFNYHTEITSVTNTVTGIFAVTNTYTLAWMAGSVNASQRGFFGQQYLYDTTNVVIKLLYYPCSDAKRDEALGILGMEVSE